MTTPATPGLQVYPLIYVSGQELSAKQREALAEMRIETELCLPGKVTMRLHDANAELAKSGDFALGSAVQVKMPNGPVLIDAIITGVGFDGIIGSESVVRKEGSRTAISELVITAYDKSILLGRTCSIKSHLTITASDLVSQIASAHGLTPQVDSTASTFAVATVASTDLQTINSLADMMGLDWWIGPNHVLNFKKPSTTSSATLTLGENSLRSFSAYMSGLAPETVTVRGFLPDGSQVNESSTLANAGTWPTTSDEGLLGRIPGQRANIPGNGTVITSLRGVASTAEGTAIAKALTDRMAAAGVLARGHGDGNPNVKVGSSVTIAGTEAVDGTYHVTKVTHVVRRDGFETRFVAGDRRPNGVVDMLGRPDPVSMPIRHDGLVVGVVTQLGDDSHKGLVKVKIPGLDNDVELQWGRFLVPGGGGSNARGFVALPEVNDHVLVGFEHGDVHRPVVIGGLYKTDNQGDWDVANGEVTKRRFKSRLGHVFSIGDGTEPADQNFVLQLADQKAVLSIAKDKVQLTTQALPIKLTDGAGSIEIDGQGNINIKGVKVSIDAQSDLELHGLNVSVKADTKISVSGLNGEFNTSAALNVSGGGQLALKAGLVQIN